MREDELDYLFSSGGTAPVSASGLLDSAAMEEKKREKERIFQSIRQQYRPPFLKIEVDMPDLQHQTPKKSVVDVHTNSTLNIINAITPEKDNKAKNMNMKYMGIHKKTGRFFVKIIQARDVSTKTGSALLIKGEDRLGRRCMWFRNLNPSENHLYPTPGDFMLVQGMVKNWTSDKFDGNPVTYLSRVSVAGAIDSMGTSIHRT